MFSTGLLLSALLGLLIPAFATAVVDGSKIVASAETKSVESVQPSTLEQSHYQENHLLVKLNISMKPEDEEESSVA